MADNDANEKAAALEILKIKLQHQETLSEALSALIQTSLRVSFLLNGAAIIAALSVYGAKGATSLAFQNAAMGGALLAWVIGLVATAIAAGFYTAAQRQFQVAAGEAANEWANRHFHLDLSQKTTASSIGDWFRAFAIGAWLASIAAFCAGAFILVCRIFLA